MNKQTSKLLELEIDIEQGIRTVGRCLTEIRETKCYLGEYETFENYCKIRWNFSDRHVRRLIDVERVKSQIGLISPVETLKYSHILEIAKIPEKQQAQVAAEVLERCETEDRKPTASDFRRAAAAFVKPKQIEIEAYDDADYEDVGDDEGPVKPTKKPPKQPTVKEQLASLRSVALQHYRAAMRAVDTMHSLKADKASIKVVVDANVVIQDAVEGGWK